MNNFSDSSSCLESESNPQSDRGSVIYGPGIRISFYLQSFFLGTRVHRNPPPRVPDCFMSKLYCRSKDYNIDQIPISSSKLWVRCITSILHYGIHVVLLVVTSLSTSTSATVKTFNECLNTITYTIFIWSVPLLSGRVIGLVFSIIATCVYVAIVARAQWILQSMNSWISDADHDTSPLPRLVVHFPRVFPKHDSPWTKPFATWWSHYLDDRIGMSFGKLGFGMTVWVYMVVSNEFLLKENHAVDAYMFDFAQVCAYFVASVTLAYFLLQTQIHHE
ncbi:hypothetical protein F5877DRAFT_69943 [Lentinula edodes]|nr:hypothetical protein F5877DRAFT_69943 [Lentinula edodes]